MSVHLADLSAGHHHARTAQPLVADGKGRRRAKVWLGGLALAVVLYLGTEGFWNWKHIISSSGGRYFVQRVEIPVPAFQQDDPRWSLQLLGPTIDTVGEQGCALTSAAMVLSFYGIDTDPQRLNDFLNANGGYTPNGWLYWEKAAAIAPGRVEKAYEDLPSYELIDDNLLAGNPVIVRLTLRNGTTHFVVVVGKQGWDYLTRDPARPAEWGVYPLRELTSRIEALRFYRELSPPPVISIPPVTVPAPTPTAPTVVATPVLGTPDQPGASSAPTTSPAGDDSFASQFRSPDASYHLSGLMTGTEGVIDRGEYKSPDGRFALEVSYNDMDFAFAMKDLRSGQSQELQGIPTPVFTLDWSPDCNTLLTVGHYAEASEAVSIHFDGKSWQVTELPPSGDWLHYHVIERGFSGGKIRLLYEMDEETPEHTLKTYTCSFVFDPVSQSASGEEQKPVDMDTYLRLRVKTFDPPPARD